MRTYTVRVSIAEHELTATERDALRAAMTPWYYVSSVDVTSDVVTITGMYNPARVTVDAAQQAMERHVLAQARGIRAVGCVPLVAGIGG